jgi:hypothetical protein
MPLVEHCHYLFAMSRKQVTPSLKRRLAADCQISIGAYLLGRHARQTQTIDQEKPTDVPFSVNTSLARVSDHAGHEAN